MKYYFLTFRSITAAQRAEQILQSAGIGTSLLRTPKNMVTEGCGYAVRVREDKVSPAARLITASNVRFGKIYVADGGLYKEVRL